MARRGQTRRAFRKGPKNNLWAALQTIEKDVLTLTSNVNDIVADSDWQRAASLERATLVRVRGSMSMTNKNASGSFAGGPVWQYIALMDEDAAAPPGNIVGTYVNEDILWTDVRTFSFADTGTVGIHIDIPIDVKAMRRMRTGQRLVHVLTNDTLVTVRYSLITRALLQLGGN